MGDRLKQADDHRQPCVLPWSRTEGIGLEEWNPSFRVMLPFREMSNRQGVATHASQGLVVDASRN